MTEPETAADELVPHRYTIDVACLLVAAVVAIATAAATQERVKERLRVAESAVLVKPPSQRIAGLPRTFYGQYPEYGEGVEITPRRSAADDDLIVYLGEQPGEVTGVQRVGRDQEWTVMIYLDASLTGEETFFRSALALARSAERLTALGPVEVLVADPEMRVLVPPTDSPPAIENALADIAMQAGNGEIGGELAALRRTLLLRDAPTAETVTQHAQAVRDLVAGQVAELSRAAGDRCHTDACLLLLVNEGFSEVPATTETETEPASTVDCCAEQSRRLARSLAAARWLTGVVAIQERSFELESSPRERPPEARQVDAAVPPENYSRNAATVPSRLSQSISPYKLDFVVRLESQPLQRTAHATGGFLAASARELQEALNDLGDRLLVWFRQPEPPPDEIVPLRVVFVPRGQDLWAPRWWRARPDATTRDPGPGR